MVVASNALAVSNQLKYTDVTRGSFLYWQSTYSDTGAQKVSHSPLKTKKSAKFWEVFKN